VGLLNWQPLTNSFRCLAVSCNGFTRTVFVILFSSSLAAAQTDECANPRSVACRERVASALQSSLGTKYPDVSLSVRVSRRCNCSCYSCGG
jgi:hypothetical protein